MAKRPNGQPKAQSKRAVSRYFPVQIAVQTNEVVKDRFDLAHAIVAARGNLNLLDQRKLSAQTMQNLLLLWFARLIEGGKQEWLEQEMEPVMEELAVITAREMISRGREIDPAYLPVGFSEGDDEAGGYRVLGEEE